MPVKPSENEEQFFKEMELKMRLQKVAEQQQKMAEAEKTRLKELHWMHCPKCGQKLATETCGAVEIDVCPSCKGLWLDMGELGEIVESSGKGTFFHKCLRVIRLDRAAHHSPGGGIGAQGLSRGPVRPEGRRQDRLHPGRSRGNLGRDPRYHEQLHLEKHV